MNRDDVDTSKELHVYPLHELEDHKSYTPVNPYSTLAPSPTNPTPRFDNDAAAAPELAYESGLELVVDLQGAAKHNDARVYAEPLPTPNELPRDYQQDQYQQDLKSRPPDTSNGKTPWTKLSRRIVIIIVAIALVIIAAIVAGAVVGTRNSSSSEPDPVSGDGGDVTTEPFETTTSTATSSTTTSSSSSPSSSSLVAIPSDDEVAIGASFTASFTYYGLADDGTGDTCKTVNTACGIMGNPGFSVQVSENLYGGGLTCGTCWLLAPTSTDSDASTISSRIVVMVNEMCPAAEYDICRQRDLSGAQTNQYNAQVNFNLCADTGAWEAFTGGDKDIGLAFGNVTRVDCDEWEGEVERQGVGS